MQQTKTPGGLFAFWPFVLDLFGVVVVVVVVVVSIILDTGDRKQEKENMIV